MIPKPPKKEPKPKKRMRQVGKRGLEWLAFRREWIKNHPPDYRDSWPCGICGQPVYKIGMELDHIKKRGSNAELRLDDDNVRPTHSYCNQSRL